MNQEKNKCFLLYTTSDMNSNAFSVVFIRKKNAFIAKGNTFKVFHHVYLIVAIKDCDPH